MTRTAWQVLLAGALTCAALSGCVAEPPRYGEVITLKAGEGAEGQYPPPGTVWRLDERDLNKLSPAPHREPPPPPRHPPPPPPGNYPPPPPWYPQQ